MKVLIVSDTHGRHGNFDRALEEVGKIDALIHLGDVEGGEEYIKAMVDCPVHIVSGNNDFFSDLPPEELFLMNGRRVLITHGHRYLVSLGTDRLKEEARRRQADIVMFGHTHQPYLEEDSDMTVLNPGSLSYPRQNGRCPSYITMEKTKKSNPIFKIHYLS